MKATFESDDQIEIMRIIKAKDMAIALWDIYQLGFKDKVRYKKEILDIYYKYDIKVDDLIE